MLAQLMGLKTISPRALHQGYRNVLVMSTGIRGWLDAGLPTEVGPAGADSTTG